MTKLEKLRDKDAEEHVSAKYPNSRPNGFIILSYIGTFKAGWNARDKIAKEYEAKLVDALESANRDLEFFFHSEKRYKEAGKENIAFDKCAEIRFAHEKITKVLAEYKRMIEGDE